MHWTHTMKDSRGVPNYLLGILSRGCVQDVTGSVGYHFFRNVWDLCVKLARLSLGDREDIFITNLIIIKSWWCAWCCTIICCRLHIYSGKAGFWFFYYCAVSWCAQIIEYIMAQWSYSFVCILHHHIIIIIQSHEMEGIEVVRYLAGTFCRVCLSVSKLSELFVFQCIGLCVISLPISTLAIRDSTKAYVFKSYWKGPQATCTIKWHQPREMISRKLI